MNARSDRVVVESCGCGTKIEPLDANSSIEFGD
jgi:hypothetical protein